MATRDDLHALVDQLPEEVLHEAAVALRKCLGSAMTDEQRKLSLQYAREFATEHAAGFLEAFGPDPLPAEQHSLSPEEQRVRRLRGLLRDDDPEEGGGALVGARR